MSKKSSGLNAGKKLISRRKRFRESSKWFLKRKYNLKRKSDPLKGSSQAKAIVLEKVQLEAKQPNSAMRKCVAPDTKVLIDGANIEISQLSKYLNKQVLCSNWKKRTLENTSLKAYMKFNPKNQRDNVFKITTKETGRTITATEDHPFYSKNGLIDLGKLKEGDKIAIYPYESVEYEEPKEKILVTMYNIEKIAPLNTKFNKIYKELKERNLLNFSTNNPNLIKITRIIGHLFGDGGIYLDRAKNSLRYKIVFTGGLDDLNEIRDDLESLKFNISKIIKSNSESIVRSNKGINKIKGISYQFRITNKSLALLLIALGTPVGDKALIDYSVPEWLNEVPNWIKKEFLRAYFGSEMSKPRISKYRDHTTVSTPMFAINKSSNIKISKFVDSLNKMLNCFNIKISNVLSYREFYRKDGNITIQYIIILSSDFNSIKSLYGNIGFVYARKKDIQARYLYQYTLFKEYIIKKRVEALNKLKVLIKEGYSISSAVREIDVDYLTRGSANYWISKNLDSKKIKVPNKYIPRFEDWLKENVKGLNNGFIWETIDKIEAAKSDDVRDITTVSKNHNFIANGFLVSNCVKCQLVKNGRQITAFVPGNNAIKLVDEHDEVLVECIGGKMGRAKGDIPAVRWQVIKVNDQSLDALVHGKIEKGRR